MLSLPIYRRRHTYYLHALIGAHKFKMLLDTGKRIVAIMREINRFRHLMARQALFDIHSINLDDTKSFEMDISRGVFKSDGPDDHKRIMEALAMFKEVKATQPVLVPSTSVQHSQLSNTV